jgi:hypothetical protein
MVTVVAVTVLEAVPPEVAAPLAEDWPVTETQLPAVTSFDVAATVSLIGVELVKVTVTWPLVFCTSRLFGDTAAAVPTTPGKAAWVLDGAGLLLAADGVAALPALPQAVATTATIPEPTRAGIQRRGRLRLAAGARLVVAPVIVDSHSFGYSFAAQRVDGGEAGGSGGGVDTESDADAHRDDDRADGGGG